MAWLLAACLGLTGEAHATGGFSCSIDDNVVKLSAEGLFTRGMGEPVLNFGGNIEVLSKQVPANLRTLELGRNNLAQTWLHGKDIKLKIYQELEGNALSWHANGRDQEDHDNQGHQGHQGARTIH